MIGPILMWQIPGRDGDVKLVFAKLGNGVGDNEARTNGCLELARSHSRFRIPCWTASLSDASVDRTLTPAMPLKD